MFAEDIVMFKVYGALLCCHVRVCIYIGQFMVGASLKAGGKVSSGSKNGSFFQVLECVIE